MFIYILLITGIVGLPSNNITAKLPLYVGIGYDLATGNPHSDKEDPGFRANIFDFTYQQNKTTEDEKFIIPDQLISHNKYSCSYAASAKEFTGTKSYQNKLQELVNIGITVPAFIVDLSFSASIDFSYIHNITQSEHSVFIQSGAQCEAYSLEMPVFDTVSLSTDFKNGVYKAYNNEISWLKIIEVFGTSFIYSSILGGRTHLYHEIKKQQYQELESTDLDIKSAAKFAFAKWSGDMDTDFQLHLKEIKMFESKVDQTQEIYVGGKPPKSGNWKEWQELVANMPAPISYSITNLSDLFTSKNFPNLANEDLQKMIAAFNNSVLEYCKNKNCIKPDPDIPLPPKVTKIVHKYDQMGSQTSPAFDDPTPENPLMMVKKIMIRSGHYIDSIQLLISDGITSMLTPYHGGHGGGYDEWQIEDDEYISQIEVYADSHVNSLRFITNKGNKSPQYGWTVGSYNLYTFKGHLSSIWGNSGDYLNSIGFYSTELVYPDQTISAMIM